MAERGKDYRARNREKCAERSKKYYNTNKTQLLEYRQNWWNEHKSDINKLRRDLRGFKPKNKQDLRKKYRHERRARMKNGGMFTAEEWNNLTNFFNNQCVNCDIMEKMTVDHIIPLSKGGRNIITNIQPLCFSCNVRKHTKTQDFTSDLILAGCDPEGIF